MDAFAQSNVFVSPQFSAGGDSHTVASALPARPLWHLVLPWLLLIPMFFIAANGTFIPATGTIDTAATGMAPGTDAAHKLSVAFVSLIYIVLIAFHFSPVFALAQRLKIVLAFPLLAIASAAWSFEPQQSVVSGALLLLFTAFAIYLSSRFPFERQLELIILVGGVFLPLSIALALLVPSIGASEAGWRGIFGHKQSCAAVSTLFLITALHWRPFGVYQKAFHGFYILMCCVLIAMSRSRTGWALALIAVLLSGALWLLQKLPIKQAHLIVLLTLPVVAGMLYSIYVFSPAILVSVGKDSTLSERTIIWAAAWDAAVKHPILGYGFGSFWKGLYGPSQSVVLIAGWAVEQAQNGFLDVWLGTGLLGVALIALMTGQGLRNAVRSLYSANHKPYVRWCILVIACTLLYNVGESSFGLASMSWLLFLLALIGLRKVADTRFPTISAN
jgi:exopolysaccharide production protein ExoQ